jgi:hypothetical protein
MLGFGKGRWWDHTPRATKSHMCCLLPLHFPFLLKIKKSSWALIPLSRPLMCIKNPSIISLRHQCTIFTPWPLRSAITMPKEYLPSSPPPSFPPLQSTLQENQTLIDTILILAKACTPRRHTVLKTTKSFNPSPPFAPFAPSLPFSPNSACCHQPPLHTTVIMTSTRNNRFLHQSAHTSNSRLEVEREERGERKKKNEQRTNANAQNKFS